MSPNVGVSKRQQAEKPIVNLGFLPKVISETRKLLFDSYKHKYEKREESAFFQRAYEVICRLRVVMEDSLNNLEPGYRQEIAFILRELIQMWGNDNSSEDAQFVLSDVNGLLKTISKEEGDTDGITKFTDEQNALYSTRMFKLIIKEVAKSAIKPEKCLRHISYLRNALKRVNEKNIHPNTIHTLTRQFGEAHILQPVHEGDKNYDLKKTRLTVNIIETILFVSHYIAQGNVESMTVPQRVEIDNVLCDMQEQLDSMDNIHPSAKLDGAKNATKDARKNLFNDLPSLSLVDSKKTFKTKTAIFNQNNIPIRQKVFIDIKKIKA